MLLYAVWMKHSLATFGFTEWTSTRWARPGVPGSQRPSVACISCSALLGASTKRAAADPRASTAAGMFPALPGWFSMANGPEITEISYIFVGHDLMISDVPIKYDIKFIQNLIDHIAP